MKITWTEEEQKEINDCIERIFDQAVSKIFKKNIQGFLNNVSDSLEKMVSCAEEKGLCLNNYIENITLGRGTGSAGIKIFEKSTEIFAMLAFEALKIRFNHVESLEDFNDRILCLLEDCDEKVLCKELMWRSIELDQLFRKLRKEREEREEREKQNEPQRGKPQDEKANDS